MTSSDGGVNGEERMMMGRKLMRAANVVDFMMGSSRSEGERSCRLFGCISTKIFEEMSSEYWKKIMSAERVEVLREAMKLGQPTMAELAWHLSRKVHPVIVLLRLSLCRPRFGSK